MLWRIIIIRNSSLSEDSRLVFVQCAFCCDAWVYSGYTSLSTFLRRLSAAAYRAGVVKNGRTRNPLALWTEPVLVAVRVWRVHIN